MGRPVPSVLEIYRGDFFGGVTDSRFTIRETSTPLATDSRISSKKLQTRDLGYCVKISSGEYGLAFYYWGNEHPARHGLDEDARDSLAEHLFGEIRESGCSFPNNRSRVRCAAKVRTRVLLLG